jgi:PucR C-terminal helix-turn-helix domain/GGDEF-like domain
MTPTASDDQRIEEIGRTLLRRHRSIGRAMAKRIVTEIPEYESAGADVVADLESLAIETARLLGEMLAGEIRGDRDDLAVIRRRVARRVDQGIALEPFLHAYRVAQGEYWRACSRQSRAADISREAAFALGSRLHEAMDTITAHAAEGYLREELRVSRRSGRATRDLVEGLIAGRAEEVGRRPAAAAGLDLGGELTVAVVRAEGAGRALDDELEALRAALEETTAGRRARRLLAVRQGELVVIAADRDGALRESLETVGAADADGGLRQSLEAVIATGHDGARGRAPDGPRAGGRSRRLDVRVGLGRPATGAASLAGGYREALLALTYTSVRRPLLSLAELGSLQVAVAGADPTSRQVIESHGAEYAALSDPTRAHVAATVRAFAAASLNVTAAASDLGLHPNTLRYRLDRIAEQTGHDPRTFAGLVELICVLEAEGQAEAGR